MTWWQVRRVGWNRYGPAARLMRGPLELGAAGLLVAAGVLARLVLLLLDPIRAHAGQITLAVAAALVVVATCSP